MTKNLNLGNFLTISRSNISKLQIFLKNRFHLNGRSYLVLTSGQKPKKLSEPFLRKISKIRLCDFSNLALWFIKLISKHFPPNHNFVKIFSKNAIKLSYSCKPNIRSKIKGHNKKMLQPRRATEIMQLPC